MLRTAGPDDLRQVGASTRSRSTTRRWSTPARSSATSCSTTATCSVAPRRRPTSRSATRRCRCSTTRRSAGCTGRRASSTRSSPTTPRPASTTTGSRFPPIDKDGTLFGGELTVVGTNGDRPEVVDFLNQFIGEDVQCAMGGVVASSRISPNVNVGHGLLREHDPRRRVGRADRRAEGRHRAFRRLRPDAGRGRLGQLLDRHGRVHEGRSRLPRRRARRHRGRAGRRRSRNATAARWRH